MNRIAYRIKKAALNDILLSTDKNAQQQMKDLYNQNDKEVNRALQILSDAGFKFTKDFFKDSKIVGFAKDVKDFLTQYTNEYLEDDLDQAVSDAVIKVTGTEENQKEIRDSFSDKEKADFVNNIVQKDKEIYNDEAVQNTSKIWLQDIINDDSLFPYLMYTINKDKGIRDYYIQDTDVVDSIIDSIDLENLNISVPEDVLLNQAKQILEELTNTYDVYQSPDGLVIMER